ncbi:MAG: class I SAM-dependent methyltransferase [Proteobacteria bacterium]|nr:class I SAM-dependent methyltransferase [Pseudomonadota bacterium]
MKDAANWQPSKFVRRRGKLTGTRDTREVPIGSRLITDLTARWYEAQIAQHVRGRLLDLGCGKVPLFEAYRPFATETVCVDWGQSLHSNGHLDLECDLTQPLPFADGEFDTIILSDVLEHIAEPQPLWREMARVLSTGGRILLNVPFFYWLHEQPHDYYRYTEYALQRFAAQADLRITHLSAIGGAPEVLADILAKNLVHLPLLGRPLAALTQTMTQFLVRAGPGRRISARTSRQFPLAYALVAEKTSAAQVTP